MSRLEFESSDVVLLKSSDCSCPCLYRQWQNCKAHKSVKTGEFAAA